MPEGNRHRLGLQPFHLSAKLQPQHFPALFLGLAPHMGACRLPEIQAGRESEAEALRFTQGQGIDRPPVSVTKVASDDRVFVLAGLDMCIVVRARNPMQLSGRCAASGDDLLRSSYWEHPHHLSQAKSVSDVARTMG